MFLSKTDPIKDRRQAMQDGDNRNTENLTREVEKIGSQLRSMSIQIEAIRARVSDLESWGPRAVIAGGKDEDNGKGKNEGGKGKEGKGKEEDGKQGGGGRYGNGNGNGNGNGKGKRGKG